MYLSTGTDGHLAPKLYVMTSSRQWSRLVKLQWSSFIRLSLNSAL